MVDPNDALDLPHPTPWLPYSPELFFRFQCYWALVHDRQRNRPDLRLPFHALGGERDRVWSRYTEGRRPSRSKVAAVPGEVLRRRPVRGACGDGEACVVTVQ